ncbi:hypothetical protein H5410_028352 [Solanum commersonii]|uniref:Secreted protein n=1 Tax=Solanum commersonii TaxID=4109 RepID=A0A9J5Z5W8_SOLCO|nr:hypothetical protein H5410_028352 [Solanum commersonii]
MRFPSFLILSSPSLHSAAAVPLSIAAADWSREELPVRASPTGAAASFPSLLILSFSFKARFELEIIS